MRNLICKFARLSEKLFFSINPVKLFLTPFLFLVFTLSATAQIANVNPPLGGFKIDGYLRANTPAGSNNGDWVPRLGSQDFTAGADSFVLNNAGVPKDNVTTKLKRDPFNSSSDSIFAQGSKFNDYISALHWSTGTAPDKNDIHNGVFHATGDNAGNQWVFIGGDRLAVNGTSYIDFEFLQGTVTINSNGTFTGSGPNGGRTDGDINISMEYNNGGSAPKVVIYRWKIVSGTTYGWDSTGSAAITQAFAQTNLQTVDVPFGAFGGTTYQAFAFVEAAINITQLISVGSGTNCGGLSIKTLWIKTKAASTSTAALKDFMSPISLDLNFGGVNIDQKGPVCVNGSNITLTGTPAGGTFSGPGVTGTTFSPADAGVGSHQIIYTATVGTNCTKKDTMYIVVNPRPTATVNSPTKCADDPAVTITATPGSGAASDYNYSWTVPAGATAPGNVQSFSASVAGSYSVVLTNKTTNCTSVSAGGTLTVNANPAQPDVTVTPPTCGNSNGTVTVTAPLDGGGIDYEYSNNGGAYQDGVSFTVAGGAGYSIVARNKTTLCTSAARAGTMGTASNTPPATAIVTQNVDCSHLHGKVKIVQASAGNPEYDNTIYEFSNDGTNFGSNPEFTFTAGGGYSLTVRKKSDHTCTATASCPAETVARISSSASEVTTASQTTVKAYPNPFSDKVNFVVTSAVAGQGNLEIYNMMGQKVKTVYQGFISAGTQNFELSLPAQQIANLIYVLRVGDKKMSGKLLQINQ